MFQKQFSCSPILFFCVATSQKRFLARPPVWTAIKSANFTDFVQRAATAIIYIAHGILSCPKPFSWAKNRRKLFSYKKLREPLLARAALKALHAQNGVPNGCKIKQPQTILESLSYYPGYIQSTLPAFNHRAPFQHSVSSQVNLPSAVCQRA